ncbi:unnamed protein product [Ilex paraguariensis]|uniref:Structural maintenance of chromosomes protein 5 n=1 Tax=Ilex paraguariensis TaxID=185542 RepID=A0ABC8S5R4_9AQUA
MDEPRPKRPKISRGEDDYLPGNITEIELHNFMTFDNLTCRPGPRLNLVIGPNGSGKSSLVCAIALGLGGDPQLLGRASSIGAYVKRGEESGHIKISLRGETEEKITITRKIDTCNKSEWLLNGNAVPKKDVIEMIQRFNIQVNNLTQLTPVQLLEETEKATGDPQLSIQHCTLVDKSRKLKDLERVVETNRKSLDQLKALNAEQERDVERVRQREELLEKAEFMKKKLPWLTYDMKKAEYVEAKEQANDAKKKLDEAAKSLNKLMEPIEKQKQEKAIEDAQCKSVRGLLDSNGKKRMQLMENENRLEVQLRGKYHEMEELRRQEESRQERIARAKDNVVAAELEFENLPPYEPPREEIENLGAQILELEETAREKRSQKSEKEKLLTQNKVILRQCVDRLKDMESTNNKRLQALRNSGAEKIFEAYYWVQEHRHEFNKEVYGPVLIEVNVSNRIHADYLEGHVPYYIWKRQGFMREDARFELSGLNFEQYMKFRFLRDDFMLTSSLYVHQNSSQGSIFHGDNCALGFLLVRSAPDRCKSTLGMLLEVAQWILIVFWWFLWSRHCKRLFRLGFLQRFWFLARLGVLVDLASTSGHSTDVEIGLLLWAGLWWTLFWVALEKVALLQKLLGRTFVELFAGYVLGCFFLLAGFLDLVACWTVILPKPLFFDAGQIAD